MVDIKELNISSMEQPAHIKVMRGPGGRYDYEISYHAPTLRDALDVVKMARAELERELIRCESNNISKKSDMFEQYMNNTPITINTEKKE